MGKISDEKAIETLTGKGTLLSSVERGERKCARKGLPSKAHLTREQKMELKGRGRTCVLRGKRGKEWVRNFW